MREHIEDIQKLNIRVKYIPEEHRIDVFIGSLKDNIQHDVRLWEPDSLEKAFRLEEKWKAKLWQPRSIPLTTIKMEAFLPLAFHNLQG